MGCRKKNNNLSHCTATVSLHANISDSYFLVILIFPHGFRKEFLPVLMVPMAYMFLENSISSNRTEVKTLSKSSKRGRVQIIGKICYNSISQFFQNGTVFSLYKPQIDTETHWMRLT
ncbi:hypothetical protein CEXT_80251 [Caerostris extrusa]|uniref:Uncharacterized protein n=1 Tax=Caerostris extrusa TaxID=172846 RepID=A0AAV4NB07_CAEEX|nr:hypothetical protein CEXT_80251 [Caerostris extrusa]